MLAWIKKYWWLITVVPAIVITIFVIVKFIVVYLTANIGVPDLSDMEREYWSESNRLNESEKEVLAKIAKEREDVWNKIDSGTSSAAAIFNEELAGNDHKSGSDEK